jgi:tRNA(Ile)-lysidine synthase
LRLVAAHANHVLRGDESEADEQFVRKLCTRRQIPLVCSRLPVPRESADRVEGIEVSARRLRHAFFAQAARDSGATIVATAHTCDDQAETVLHRILRGTGPAGLAGIPASRELAPGIRLARPFLEIRRAEVLQYLNTLKQDTRQDSSNLDPSFTRNRIRHELLPYLAEHFNPQVAQALSHLAMLASGAQEAIDAQVDRLVRRVRVPGDRSTVVLKTGSLQRLPRFLVSELVRQVWMDQGWPLREIGQFELDQVAELVLAGGAGAGLVLPGGVRVERTRDRLILRGGGG